MDKYIWISCRNLISFWKEPSIAFFAASIRFKAFDTSRKKS